jgi:hypothetical protein
MTSRTRDVQCMEYGTWKLDDPIGGREFEQAVLHDGMQMGSNGWRLAIEHQPYGRRLESYAIA